MSDGEQETRLKDEKTANNVISTFLCRMVSAGMRGMRILSPSMCLCESCGRKGSPLGTSCHAITRRKGKEEEQKPRRV